MSGDVTYQALERLTHMQDRTGNQGDRIAGQYYDDVYFKGGIIDNTTQNGTILNNVTINGGILGNLVVNGTVTATGGFLGDLTGNVTGNVSGNAGTATALQTTRTFAIGGTSGLTAAAQNFNGTQNVSLLLSGILTSANGGTGVNNGSFTATLGGNLSTAAAFTQAGAFATTLTSTGVTNVTLPTTGTLATLAGTETLTNKTFSAGNVWNGGVIAGQYGGTGVANTGKTITVSGNTTIGSTTNTVAFTTTGNTSVALPTTGTLATLAGTETFTNKTYATPTITGNASSNGNFNTTYGGGDAFAHTRGGTTFSFGAAGDGRGIFNNTLGADVLFNINAATHTTFINGGTLQCIGIYNTIAGSNNVSVAADGKLSRMSSALKYKTDIHPYNRTLEEIKRMVPVWYRSKTEPTVQYAGVISDWLMQEGFNEFVETNPEGEPEGARYANMIAACLRGIHLLIDENEGLKQRIEQLETV